MSNMDMKIFINKNLKNKKMSNRFILDKNNIHNNNFTIFYKKIFKYLEKH